MCETKTRTHTVLFVVVFSSLNVCLCCVVLCMHILYIIHTVSFRCLRRCLWQRRSFLTASQCSVFLRFYFNFNFFVFWDGTKNFFRSSTKINQFTHFWKYTNSFVWVLNRNGTDVICRLFQNIECMLMWTCSTVQICSRSFWSQNF